MPQEFSILSEVETPGKGIRSTVVLRLYRTVETTVTARDKDTSAVIFERKDERQETLHGFGEHFDIPEADVAAYKADSVGFLKAHADFGKVKSALEAKLAEALQQTAPITRTPEGKIL